MFLGVVSVMAGLLFREIIGPDYKSPMTFSDFYVSYLGMYQVLLRVAAHISMDMTIE